MLQNYVTVYSQNEPLAKFWNVTDNEVITLLELERNLTMVDVLLQPILEEYNTSFGGSYINVLMNLYEQALRLKPLWVFCIIDIEFNNVGLFLYENFSNINREFLEAIQQYNVTLHYMDKPHPIQSDADE
ncbi:45968_t:CDS:2 [Gigaspora margarita]|uniref:45968_t:CDS:1 n=1 Tax=Gigaspora margarita TaxID=4874 RepID=A0ABN7VWX0_GIGMA|nr:45968_t:CDS:2 [Gigaspora margarita]